MKLKKTSLLVRSYVLDRMTTKRNNDVDMIKCQAVVDKICETLPELKADTIEQADEVIKQFMDNVRNLQSNCKDLPELNTSERVMVVSLLMTKIEMAHLDAEHMLYDLGVIERGETNT